VTAWNAGKKKNSSSYDGVWRKVDIAAGFGIPRFNGILDPEFKLAPNETYSDMKKDNSAGYVQSAGKY
jgi:hypothetical protein